MILDSFVSSGIITSLNISADTQIKTTKILISRPNPYLLSNKRVENKHTINAMKKNNKFRIQ